ncbi:MAG: cytochrome-c peroxidase [Crocinitomicaceae bacterium]|nr:cytochrome-c peroxidase [Crocinitomicaceae bacterium]
MQGIWSICFILMIAVFLGCNYNEQGQISPLGKMEEPLDNKSSKDKIELGRKLFFDKRLSSNNKVSCASCHIPELAFTDGKKKSIGVENRFSMRNAPSLLNSGYLKTTMYDAHIETLELQMLVPLQDHSEMNANLDSVISILKEHPEYKEAAQTIFQRDFDPWVLTRSIAAYERSLISDNSKFDKWKRGEATFSNSEKRGWQLFSKKLNCKICHIPPHFTNYKAEHNGLYDDYEIDKGRFRIFNDSMDIGFFKVPSLRNVALTAPYMHDGSIPTLNNVLDHYVKGGKEHIGKSKYIVPFSMTKQDRIDIIRFLNTLTDTSYLHLR